MINDHCHDSFLFFCTSLSRVRTQTHYQMKIQCIGWLNHEGGHTAITTMHFGEICGFFLSFLFFSRNMETYFMHLNNNNNSINNTIFHL